MNNWKDYYTKSKKSLGEALELAQGLEDTTDETRVLSAAIYLGVIENLTNNVAKEVGKKSPLVSELYNGLKVTKTQIDTLVKGKVDLHEYSLKAKYSLLSTLNQVIYIWAKYGKADTEDITAVFKLNSCSESLYDIVDELRAIAAAKKGWGNQ